MEVVRTIQPGDAGSHRFLDEWGDKLVAVRYRKSACGKSLYTTIESSSTSAPQIPTATACCK